MADASAGYRLNPKGAGTDAPPQPCILLIDDDLSIQELMTAILEAEGYAVILARAPADAEALFREVAFDLVIPDAFSPLPAAVMANTASILAAGSVPVALFTAHRIELDAALAAGFSDLISKPFHLATLERQLRAILQR